MDKEIQQIVERIVKFYSPEAIILFGSAVKGEIHPNSDIDLMVIKKTSKKPIWRRVEARKIAKAEVPIDIIVLTPEEFIKLKQSRSPFLMEIIDSGKILYEKEHPQNSHLFKMD